MTTARPGWGRVATPFLVVSVLVVAASLVTRLLAYELQVADPGSAPIPALRWFDVNSERNVPTAWSVSLLLAGSVLAGSLALRRPVLRSGWVLVAAVAGVLALDEALALHERLGGLGRTVAGDGLHFTWVAPGLVIASVVGVVMLGALRQQPLVLRRRLVLSGAVYLAGALVLETVSGLVLRAHGDRELYVAVTALEEGLEMAGACLLVGALVVERRGLGRRPRTSIGSAA